MAAPPPRSGSIGRGWTDAAVLAGYCLVSFLFFGVRLIVQPGAQYIGPLDDPQIPIWSFAWWPHAITHGTNPVITNVLWAPDGINLTWANAVPSLAILFWPLTALVGPFTSYNVAVILIPAASAWTGYLLCRRLTRATWPSVVGGYLFGFSTYLLGQQAGHLQLISVFFIPVVALLVLRFLDGELGRVGLALWLAAILVLQLLFSMELDFTMTLALGIALVLGFLLAPERRRAIVSALPPLVAGYVLAGIVAAPWLYYTLKGLRIAAFQPPEQYLADLANLVIPTSLSALGAGWSHSITDRFPGNDAERIAYLGVPALVIAALYAWRYRHTSGARFLVACAAVAVFLSLGPELTVAGHAVLPLPTVFGHDYWTIPGFGTIHLSLFNNVLPDRLMLYTSLVVAVMVALWAARTPHRTAARVLPALAVLALVPNPWADAWATTYRVPPFFTDDAYRDCLAPDENVLPLPIGQGGDSMLWQTKAGFRFRMAGGRITTSPPSSFLHPDELAQISVGYDPTKDQVALFRNYFRVKKVTSVLVDKRQASLWRPSLDRIAKPEDVGGIYLYRVAGAADPAGLPEGVMDEERYAPIVAAFDEIAAGGAHVSRARRGYHELVTALCQAIVPPGASVLELGSGDGDLLAALAPQRGVGVDVSEGMTALARERHPGLEFVAAAGEDASLDERFDYVVLSDLLPYVDDLLGLFTQVAARSHRETRIVINSWSQLWRPALRVLELLRLKQRTPVRNWVTPDDVENLLRLAGLETVTLARRILLPLRIPILSGFFNGFLANLPIVRHLCLTYWIVARPQATGERRQLSVSVLVPARNEAGMIERIVAETPELGTRSELIFVEGHSTDGTADEIRRQIELHPEREIVYLAQPGKGKGDAVRHGFEQARYDVLMILDADLTVRPQELPRFLEAIESGRAEFVNGSRLVYGLEPGAMRFLNLLGNKAFSHVFSALLGQPVKDTLCGTKVLDRHRYEQIAAGRSYFGDFDPFGDFDLLLGAARLNLKIVDLPVRYHARTYGDTKISRFRHGWLLLHMAVFAFWKLRVEVLRPGRRG